MKFLTDTLLDQLLYHQLQFLLLSPSLTQCDEKSLSLKIKCIADYHLCQSFKN